MSEPTPKPKARRMSTDGTPCILFIGTEETLRALGWQYALPCKMILPCANVLGERFDMVLNSVPEFSERENDWFNMHVRARMVPGAQVLTVKLGHHGRTR